MKQRKSLLQYNNELPRRELRGIRSHAGHDPASSLNSWIPAPVPDPDPGFAGMTIHGKPQGIKPIEIQILFLLLLLHFTAPYLYADHDNSLRTDLNFNYTINDKFRSTNYVFLQADDDMSNYDYVEWGTGLQYQTPLAWLSVLLYYQQGYTKDDDRHWLLEQKPSINMNTVVTLFHFKISNQIRYEYRITPDWHDFRIKNTLDISRPDVFLKPNVGWELFYENHDGTITLNRIKFGIVKDIDDHFSLGPYYRIDFSKVNNQWEWTRQLIGFQVTIKY